MEFIDGFAEFGRAAEQLDDFRHVAVAGDGGNLEDRGQGEIDFTLPSVLQIPPISGHGNVPEIIELFGGAPKLREAVDKLQALLYAKES